MASNRYGDLLASPDSAGRYGDLFERAERNKKNKFAATRIGISDIRVKLNSFRGYEPISVFGELINEVKTAISEFEQNKKNQDELDKIKDEIPRFLERGLAGAAFAIGEREGKPIALICSNKAEAQNILYQNPQDRLYLTNSRGFTEAVGGEWKNIEKYNLISDENILIFVA